MQSSEDISASRIDIHRIILTLHKLDLPSDNVTIVGDPWLAAHFNITAPEAILAAPDAYLDRKLLLCVDQDDNLYDLLDVCFKHGIQFYPVRHADRIAKYWHFKADARATLLEERQKQDRSKLTHWDSADFANIVQAIDITKGLSGSYVEIGVFNGASGSVALNHMRRLNIARDTFFFDVFEGFTYETAVSSADAMWVGTHATQGMDMVGKRLSDYSTEALSVTVARKDITQDVLPEAVGTIAVANIDVDLYEAVLAALQKCAPRMQKSGIIIIEDAGHTPMLIGARYALQKFMETQEARRFTPVYLESGQTYLICMDT